MPFPPLFAVSITKLCA